MKIVHLCLSCFYIDGFSYQENELIAQNVLDGHDVVVIASTETFATDQSLVYIAPGDYMGTDGARVIRLPYSRGPHPIMRKLRSHPGVYDLLQREEPDVILFHGLCSWELNTVVNYKKNNPNVKLFVDSHEDFNNSARSFISKNLLHRLYYKPIVKSALSYIDKILCISLDTIEFVHKFYRVPMAKIEFYPLGGRIFSDNEYEDIRARTREKYQITEDQILIVQSGKIDAKKKLTYSLREFAKVENSRVKFIIAGSLHKDIEKDALELISRDSRVNFVGWKKSGELRDLLCAADVYLQPGSQSATMQMSICCRCSVILAAVSSHIAFIKENGWLLEHEGKLREVFLSLNATNLNQMSKKSAQIASDILDYRKLASRIYS